MDEYSGLNVLLNLVSILVMSGMLVYVVRVSSWAGALQEQMRSVTKELRMIADHLERLNDRVRGVEQQQARFEGKIQ